MRIPVGRWTHDEALAEVRLGFYGGDLDAAQRAGQSVLASIDPETRDAVAQGRRAVTLLWLTRCARRADTLDVALHHAYAGMSAARIASDCRLECQVWAQFVHVLASLGQNESALKHGYDVLRRAADSGDVLAQAASWLALGQVHWTMNQWQQGKQAYAEALELAGRCGDDEVCGLASNGIAAMEDHLATEARAAGRVEEAEAHSRRSLALLIDFTESSQQIGDGYNAWIGLHNQARCLHAMGEHATAHELLDEQLDMVDDEHGTRYQLVLQALGELHLAEGRPDLAVACQTEALEIAERLQVPLLALDACGGLVDALELTGDLQAALTQHRRYHALYVQLASNRAQAQARALEVMYETEKAMALAESLRERAEQLASTNDALVEERTVLQRVVLQDALTGLANRRHFDEVLAALVDGDVASPGFALAMIDVDHFKQVNDRFSHLAGDEVLRRLGALLRQHARQVDLSARYGGEEFALILVDVDAGAARNVCERLRAAVAAERWPALDLDVQVTVSIGLVHVEEADLAGDPTGDPTGDPMGDPMRLVALADSRLYDAKRAGRNQVVDGRRRVGATDEQ